MADARYKATRQRTTHNRLVLTVDTETELIAAGGAGVKRDLTFLLLVNSHASTAVDVHIRDALAGTIRMTIRLVAGANVPVPIPVPLPQAVADAAWTAEVSAAVSTVYITAITLDAG